MSSSGTRSTMRIRIAFVACLCALSFALLWSAACTSSARPSSSQSGPGGDGTSPPIDACGHPNPGCPCTDQGLVGECGEVELRAGDYVTCAMGKTTCDGTVWGACTGEIVAVNSFSGGGLRFASLGGATTCSTNPCDPYCQNFVDTPGGLDAAGFNVNDAGLSVGAPTSTCLCNAPVDPATMYQTLPVAYAGNPASCTGTGATTDNCNHDTFCGDAGTCLQYATAGYNPSCATSPDYTLGASCFDGTNWELQVCNRGLVPSPGFGKLVIGISPTSPSGTKGSMAMGPTIAPAVNAGWCQLDLATTTIGPGQCINVNTSTCVSSSGGPLNLQVAGSPTYWAFVNAPVGIVPDAGTPVPECDTSNNYTALGRAQEPPANAGASTCALSVCGTVCGGASDAGVEGGAGCHTYVSGTVYDPGANVPLASIAVYEPSGALVPFPAGVHCDTCTSVLSPYKSATFSDLAGAFNLEVDTLTNVPVVFQTGRWRRPITVAGPLVACAVNTITVAADCTYPGTNCTTRLPQTAAEGDIPLTAVVTGLREPFECSIAKFMGGSQEVGVQGSGKRIVLFLDNGADTLATVFNSGTTAAVSAPITKNSTKASVTTKVGSTVTITGLSGMVAGYVGGTLTISGAASGGNNGTFPITAFVSAASVKITNAAAVAPDGNNGRSAFRWTAVGPGAVTISGLTGMTAASVGHTLTLSGASSSANNGSSVIATFINATTVTVIDPGAVDADAHNGSITWKETGPTVAIPDTASNLWPTQAALNAFDQVIMGCGGNTSEVATLGSGATNLTATNQGYYYNFMKAGGRTFVNHWAARGLLIPTASGGYAVSPFNATSTFQKPSIQSAPGNTLHGKVAPPGPGNVPQQNFATWLTNQGAYAGGVLTTPQPVSGEALVPTAGTSFEWVRGDTVDTFTAPTGHPAGDYSLAYSFDTNATGIVPTLLADGGAGAGCGRTVLSDMHVDVSRSNSGSSAGTFPDECLLSGDLSPNEQAFEYMFFMLSSCAVGGAPIVRSAPPPPPNAPTLPGVTFTRDFHAVCAIGTVPVWLLFNWQAAIPTGTKIDFTARTAADVGGAPGAYGPAVPVGTASSTTSGWTTQAPPCTVNDHLKNLAALGAPLRPECTGALPAQKSLPWLRVTMTFTPVGSSSPVLQAWQQMYDCVPIE